MRVDIVVLDGLMLASLTQLTLCNPGINAQSMQNIHILCTYYVQNVYTICSNSMGISTM